MTAGWTRVEAEMEASAALAAIAGGSAWVLFPCYGPPWDSTDRSAREAIDYVRTGLVDPVRRAQLAARAARKGRSATVVIAEQWQSATGVDLIVFHEGPPEVWPHREDPRRRPDHPLV